MHPDREPAAEDRAKGELPLGADVPDAGAKADGEADAISTSGVALTSSSAIP